MPRIKTLATRSFRGITDEALPFDGRSIVLLGEKGTGKQHVQRVSEIHGQAEPA